MPTTAPPGLGGPTATTSPTSLHKFDNTTVSSAPQLPTTLSAHARSFLPRPHRAPRELLPSVAPRRPDRRTASSPPSVAEAIQPHPFPATQKPGYKIELCRNYDKPGGCRFGDRCICSRNAEMRTGPLLTQHLEEKLDAIWFRRHPCFDQVPERTN